MGSAKKLGVHKGQKSRAGQLRRWPSNIWRWKQHKDLISHDAMLLLSQTETVPGCFSCWTIFSSNWKRIFTISPISVSGIREQLKLFLCFSGLFWLSHFYLKRLSHFQISVASTFRRHQVHTMQDLYTRSLLSHVINSQVKWLRWKHTDTKHYFTQNNS